MSLLEAELNGGRSWTSVREGFSITRKPQGLNVRALAEIPFAAMEAVPQGGSFDATFTMKSPQEIKSGTYFERGDLLVAKITPSFENGKQAFVRELPMEFGYATTEVIPLRPRNNKHDPRLLFYYLLHPDVRHHVAERMEGSTGRQRVPEEVLLDVPIPKLKRAEQVAIANALETIQNEIAAESRAGTHAVDLKRAAMRTLFSCGLRGKKQKETEIGSMPVGWNPVELRDVRQWLQYGTSTHCTTDKRSHPVLRIPNVGAGRVNATELKYCDLPDAEVKKYVLEPGDLLFIRTNGVLERLGSCAVYQGAPSEALFASYLIRARMNKEVVDPRYVAHFYGSDVGTALVAGRATPAADGKYNLNTGTIDSLPLPLPPTLEEQVEIVNILETIDRKIELHQQKRAVLEELFKSLLHKLMTGEIRVDQLDLSALQPQATPEESPA